MRRMYLSMLALLLFVGLAPIGQVAAQSDARCFTETGQCISGSIRTYWERNGGLAVFGYPTTPLQTETIEGQWTGPTQWFQRDRLEDHSNEGLGVLAGRLGAQYLELAGRPWQMGNAGGSPPTGCRSFPETGYTLCGTFRAYWERNGGLERFGYPITAATTEVIEGRSYTVQYLERRRMELHPENAGTPYEVLLGLLGNEVSSQLQAAQNCAVPVTWNIAGDYKQFGGAGTLGCSLPGEDYNWVQGAAAHFERGQMYWVNLRGGRSVIYVILYGPNNTLSARLFQDTYREGDPYNTGLTPPPGLYEPSGGFGKVWRENQDIRDAIGWAREPEHGVNMNYQVFERGAILQPTDEQVSWYFGNNGAVRSANRQY